MPTVDEFIRDNVPAEFHDIVAEIRELMRECAPEATEKVAYGMPMWSVRWPVAWITASKSGISFGFRSGAYFDDPYGLLKGQGKHARNVKIKTPAGMNKEALRHYIRQAVEHDRETE